MKFIKKCIVFLMTATMLFSIASCKKNENENTVTNTAKPKETYSYTGTHVNNVTETDKPFIVNGKTEYKLVVPAQLSSGMREAVEDFRLLFKKATNISLPTVPDTGLKHTQDTKYLSIGDNELFRSTGLSVSRSELGLDGYQIFTQDNSIYMVGGGEDGSIYSIYSYFKLMFNYECYYSDCVVIDTGVKNMNFKILEVKEIPDMALRNGMMVGEMLYPLEHNSESKYFKNRMRARHWKSDWQLPVHQDYDKKSATNYSHSSFTLLPPAVYQTEHPDWYANTNKQLCYSARGNAEEFELMVQESAKKVLFSYVSYDPIAYPNCSVIQIGMQDDPRICYCDACNKISEECGGVVAPVIIYINAVAEKIAQWEKGVPITEIFDESVIGDDAEWMGVDPEPYYREDFRITFFAYHGYTIAPVEYDETKDEYIVKDERMRMHENAGVFFAAIESDYQQSILAEDNADAKHALKSWGLLTDYIWTWNYGFNYRAHGLFYDSFDTFTSTEYAYRANCNVSMHMVEGLSDKNTRNTAFANLKVYLMYNLAWNTSLDEQELIANWFDAMFGEGADIMYDYFISLRTHSAYNNQTYNLHTHASLIYPELNSAIYWKKGTVMQWMRMCDEALAKVEKYKTSNPEYYEMLRAHIRTEYISPAFLYLCHYGEQEPKVKIDALYVELREDAIKYDLLNTSMVSGLPVWGEFIGVV